MMYTMITIFDENVNLIMLTISKKPHISIIVPVYRCCESLEPLYKRLLNTLTVITNQFEIILIDDASPDDAWEKISILAQHDFRVKGIRFSRNFGQHHAISAGIDQAVGDWAIVMDCDLQDRPEEIVKLYQKAQEGYDIVWGKRVERQDHWFKKMGSYYYHKVYDYFTERRTDSTIANFSIISSQVVHELRKFTEQGRSFPIFVEWLGFNMAMIEIEHAQREFGKSAYTLKKLIRFAMDSIVAQSNKPLRLSIQIGFSLALLSCLYAVWLIIRYFLFGTVVEGWTSVMVSIYFLAGLLLANLGVIGLYIGRIFDEVKARPLYIVKEKLNFS